MGVLQLPRRLHRDFRQLKKKPAGPVEIDWSNPLTRGLILFPIFNTSGYAVYDAAQDRLYRDATHSLSQSNFTVAQGRFGQKVDCAGAATSQRLRLTEDVPNTEEGYRTVLTGAIYTDAGKDHTVMHHGTTVGALENILIWADTFSGSLRPSINAGVSHDGATGSIPTNQFVVWGTGYIVTSGSASAQHWVNGDKSGSLGSDIGDTRFLDAKPINFANENSGGRQHKGAIYFYAIWERELTPAEHRSFARDPYQFLKPRTAAQSVYFRSEGGGGSTTHEGSLLLGHGAALSHTGAWDAFVTRQMAAGAGQALAGGVEAERSLSIGSGASQVLSAVAGSNLALALSAGVGQAPAGGAELGGNATLSAGASQQQAGGNGTSESVVLSVQADQVQVAAADFTQSINLSAAFDQSQAGGSDFAGDLSLPVGVAQSQVAEAQIGGAITLSSGAGLTTSTNATFEGLAALGISAGLNQNVQWIAEAVAALAAGVGESYSYGATQDAALALGAGVGQSEAMAAEFGATLTLSAQFDQVLSGQTDWAGEIALAARLADGRSITGVFGAAVTLGSVAGQTQVAGLSQEAQLALGAALADAMAAAIGQQSPTWQIVTVPYENRTITVAVELRSLKITR